MNRFIKKSRQEIGLAPDELIFRGQQKTDQVSLRLIDFDANHLSEEDVKTVKEIIEFQHKNTVTWINVDDLHNTSIMQEMTAAFNLDTLVMAEVLNTDARPRVIEYDNCALITVKMLQLDENTGKHL